MYSFKSVDKTFILLNESRTIPEINVLLGRLYEFFARLVKLNFYWKYLVWLDSDSVLIQLIVLPGLRTFMLTHYGSGTVTVFYYICISSSWLYQLCINTLSFSLASGLQDRQHYTSVLSLVAHWMLIMSLDLIYGTLQLPS